MGLLRNEKPDVTALATREDAAGVVRAPGDRGLRVVVHDYVGHPFQVHLSRELARRGVDVLHLHCDSFLTGKGAVEDADDEGLLIEGLVLSRDFAKYSPWIRLRQERQYGAKAAARIREFRPDVVLSANTPLLAQKRILSEAKRLGSRFVFWQQDILGIGVRRVLEQRYGRLGTAIGNRFVALERSLLLASDAVAVISDGFLPTLEQLGIPMHKIYVIENWAPIDELPLRPRANEWARQHDLVGKRVVLYSGTLGLKHDPEALVQLARHFSKEGDVEVVVVSEGLGADWLRRRREEECLVNLRLLPFQSYAALPDVLASGDVLLTLLEANAGAFSVPSKVLSYLCAGRALLAAVPSDNLAAEVVHRSGGGVLVDPGDEAGLIAGATRLLADVGVREELGRRARRYAEETFDIASIGDKFEAILDPRASREGENQTPIRQQRRSEVTG
jgi:glycosyltransferase involved in cell wall biosynthesis